MAVSSTYSRVKTLLRVLLVLAAFAYVLTFSITNNAKVEVNLLFTQLHDMPVELLVISTFVLGALSGLLAASYLLYRMYRRNRLLLRQYAKHLG